MSPCSVRCGPVNTHATVRHCSATLDVDKRFTFCCCSTIVLKCECCPENSVSCCSVSISCTIFNGFEFSRAFECLWWMQPVSNTVLPGVCFRPWISPCWSLLGVHRTGDTVAKRMITGKAPPTKQKLCTMAVLIIPVRSQEFFARNAPALLLREYRRFTGGLLKVYLMCSKLAFSSQQGSY